MENRCSRSREVGNWKERQLLRDQGLGLKIPDVDPVQVMAVPKRQL